MRWLDGIISSTDADGHFDCFHVLVIVNSAVVNTGVHVSFQIMVFSGCSYGETHSENSINKNSNLHFLKKETCIKKQRHHLVNKSL